jgi:hypothetical protein
MHAPITGFSNHLLDDCSLVRIRPSVCVQYTCEFGSTYPATFSPNTQVAKALNITLPTGPAAEGEAEAITAAPQGLTLPPEEVCTPTVNATLYTTEAPEIQAGLQYFRSLLPYQIAASQAMTKAISSGDVAAAKALYAATRPIYEQIEVRAARGLVTPPQWGNQGGCLLVLWLSPWLEVV